MQLQGSLWQGALYSGSVCGSHGYDEGWAQQAQGSQTLDKGRIRSTKR